MNNNRKIKRGNNYLKEIEKEDIVPIWEKYVLTVDEAAKYFGLGENKIREIIANNLDAEFWFWNGNRKLIKRRLFEQYIDRLKVA